MDTVTQEIRKLHAEADDTGREKIIHELGAIQASLETDANTILKLAAGPFHLALVKTGVDQGIFQAVNEHPHTLSELAEKTGVPLDPLELILRGQVAFGMISEGTGVFTANRLTTLLAGSNTSGAVNYIYDIMRPVAAAIPDFLTGEEPAMTSAHNTVFQKAFNTQLSIFEWMGHHPEHFGNLFKLISVWTRHEWVEAFPIAEEIGSFMGSDAEKVVLVDVGGGTGPQAAIFKQRLPQIPGRVIVQDIAETLVHAQPIAGIEFMEHDCFMPQPIENAKFYYLRYVMHLWQDEQCVRALRAIIPAMGPESRILIDEVVVPEAASGVTWQVAWRSLGIAASLAGKERTRGQWETLCEAAGLCILDVFPYDPNMQAIIVAVPRS
ncbi:methyltransferase B [Aspergillus californicus]